MKKSGKVVLLLLTVICWVTSIASALELVTEVRVESIVGEPVQEEFTFSGQGYEGFVLKAINGAGDGSGRISSAIVSLNGVKILGPADFNQKVAEIERAIAPNDLQNTLSVSLRSNPGGFLQLQILGEPTLNLPPDPGAAGDATIEGVDTNENGIRDDIERWIGLSYRDSEKTRMALTQLYYPMQDFMIHALQGDRDAVYDDMDTFGRGSECLHYIRPDDAYLLMRELKAVVVNTSDRVYAHYESSRILGGGSFPSKPYSKWKQSCTFDPDALEN